MPYHDNGVKQAVNLYDHPSGPTAADMNMRRQLSEDAALVLHPSRQFRSGSWHVLDDRITEECTVSISWSDAASETQGHMCLRAWPRDLARLAAGHVLLEIAGGLEGTQALVIRTGDRDFRVRLEQVPAEEAARPEPPRLRPDRLLTAMGEFTARTSLWDATGCFHQAAVLDPLTGGLIARAQDIGRHNCLDRLAGWRNDTGTPFADKVLLLSARLTGSLTAKALTAGFRALVSRSAVTTDAVAMASEAGAMLVGFARHHEGRFTLYADPCGRMDDGR